jgi:hypothetical protein
MRRYWSRKFRGNYTHIGWSAVVVVVVDINIIFNKINNGLITGSSRHVLMTAFLLCLPTCLNYTIIDKIVAIWCHKARSTFSNSYFSCKLNIGFLWECILYVFDLFVGMSLILLTGHNSGWRKLCCGGRNLAFHSESKQRSTIAYLNHLEQGTGICKYKPSYLYDPI